MRCETCRGLMVQSQRHTFLDEGDHLDLGVWRCPSCGEVMEEIHHVPRGQKLEVRRLRYAVRPWAIYQRSGSVPNRKSQRRQLLCCSS